MSDVDAAKSLAARILARMNVKERRELKQIAKEVVEESQEADADAADAVVALAAPPEIEDLPVEGQEGPTYLDTSHASFSDLVHAVFGTRFVPMEILARVLERYLEDKGLGGGLVVVRIHRPGQVRLATSAGASFRGLPAVSEPSPEGVYTVWGGRSDDALLVPLEDWIPLGRRMYRVALKSGLETRTSAREKFGSFGVVRSRAPKEESGSRIWRWFDYDVWGNVKSGFDINQTFRTGQTIELPVDVFVEGGVLLKKMREAGILNKAATVRSVVVVWGDEHLVEFGQKKDGRPIGRLVRETDE